MLFDILYIGAGKLYNSKIRRTLILTVTFIIIILLILTSYYFITNFFVIEKEKISNKEEPPKKITDNRVSPLENQGLILEINRVRHRGLLESIMKHGNSWKKKLMFYIVTNIDEGEYSVYNEYGYAYNTWDTIGKEFRVIRDVREEQNTSDVIITIIEREKKGIFKLTNIEEEKIELTYNYRTGRWTGDDFFDDSDGYGHFLGNSYEIWFNIYQTDFDQDGIPYWTEINILDTDPQVDDSELDPDGDGVPTVWEWRWGYNPNVWDDHKSLDPDIDGLENIEEYQMRNWFANPFYQDIYIEVDGMKKSGLFDSDHILYEETKQILIERFSAHKINLYIDDGWSTGLTNGGGELLPCINDKICWDSGMVLQYYNHHFPDEREGIFRYTLICCNSKPPAFCGNTVFNRFDTIVIGSLLNKPLIEKLVFTQKTKRIIYASYFLHELCHTLGIGPNTIHGCDNISFKNKYLPSKERKQFLSEWGNYKSVMNYYYMGDKNIVDYSDGTHGYNDQNDWEKIYLPYFQVESDVVVDPFYYPITKKGVDENVTIKLDGWNYSKDLTKKYLKNNSNWSLIDPIKCNWCVFVKTDEKLNKSDRNIRIYAKPNVPFSVWSLCREGYLDRYGNIKFN